MLDRFRAGTTIASSLDGLIRERDGGPDLASSSVRRRVEAAVLDLLAGE